MRGTGWHLADGGKRRAAPPAGAAVLDAERRVRVPNLPTGQFPAA
jgi:hypothetical protein